MKRLASSAVFVMTIVGVLVVVALILSTGLGAVGRYLGLSGITWSFEMVGILFLWTTAIGAVLSEVAGENVSIDGNTSTSGRNRWFRIYHNLILLAVAAAFLWSGKAMLARTGFVPTPRYARAELDRSEHHRLHGRHSRRHRHCSYCFSIPGA